MNFFQQELQRFLGKTPEFENASYIGRKAFAQLSNGVTVTAQFITLGTHEHYEGLQLKALTPDQGVIDTTVLRFRDYCSKRTNIGTTHPHIWQDLRGGYEWYHEPSQAEIEAITAEACEYVRGFQPMQEQKCSDHSEVNMTMGGM